MERKKYTVEELMMNDSFLSFCLDMQNSDKEFWEKEMELHSDQRAVFADARYMIFMLHGKLGEDEVNRQVEKIKNLINYKKDNPFPSGNLDTIHFPQNDIADQYSNIGNRQRSVGFYLLCSLVTCLFLFIGVYLFRHLSAKTSATHNGQAEVVYRSGVGERKSVRLPDGSEVILNSNSSILLSNGFNQKDRQLALEGEAFFQVAKDPSKPFIVSSGAFSTTAVGTSFYVQARADTEKDYKVDLLEGKVKLSKTTDKNNLIEAKVTMLKPGEAGTWQSSKSAFTKSFCDSIVLRKWISGKLSFKNVPVEKLLQMLQQWYGVDIIVKHKKWDKLALTGDYDNKPLDHVLKIICFSLSASYSYSANQVIIE